MRICGFLARQAADRLERADVADRSKVGAGRGASVQVVELQQKPVPTCKAQEVRAR